MHIARRYPRFGRLLAALAASQLGDWLYNLALLAYVQERTHSTVWLGVTTAARIAPMVVGGPIGGLIADRFDRRRLMFASDVVRAGVMGALVLVALAGLPVALVPAARRRGHARRDRLPAERRRGHPAAGRRARTSPPANGAARDDRARVRRARAGARRGAAADRAAGRRLRDQRGHVHRLRSAHRLDPRRRRVRRAATPPARVRSTASARSPRSCARAPGRCARCVKPAGSSARTSPAASSTARRPSCFCSSPSGSGSARAATATCSPVSGSAGSSAPRSRAASAPVAGRRVDACRRARAGGRSRCPCSRSPRAPWLAVFAGVAGGAARSSSRSSPTPACSRRSTRLGSAAPTGSRSPLRSAGSRSAALVAPRARRARRRQPARCARRRAVLVLAGCHRAAVDRRRRDRLRAVVAASPPRLGASVGVGREQAEPLGHPGGLDPGAGVELGQDPGDVDGDRLLADVELAGDLAVGGAARHQPQDVELAGGKADPLGGRGRGRAPRSSSSAAGASSVDRTRARRARSAISRRSGAAEAARRCGGRRRASAGTSPRGPPPARTSSACAPAAVGGREGRAVLLPALAQRRPVLGRGARGRSRGLQRGELDIQRRLRMRSVGDQRASGVEDLPGPRHRSLKRLGLARSLGRCAARSASARAPAAISGSQVGRLGVVGLLAAARARRRRPCGRPPGGRPRARRRRVPIAIGDVHIEPTAPRIAASTSRSDRSAPSASPRSACSWASAQSASARPTDQLIVCGDRLREDRLGLVPAALAHQPGGQLGDQHRQHAGDALAPRHRHSVAGDLDRLCEPAGMVERSRRG